MEQQANRLTKLQLATLANIDTPRGRSDELRRTRKSLDKLGLITLVDNQWVLTANGRAAISAATGEA